MSFCLWVNTNGLTVLELADGAYNELPNSDRLQLKICDGCELEIEVSQIFS